MFSAFQKLNRCCCSYQYLRDATYLEDHPSYQMFRITCINTPWIPMWKWNNPMLREQQPTKITKYLRTNSECRTERHSVWQEVCLHPPADIFGISGRIEISQSYHTMPHRHHDDIMMIIMQTRPVPQRRTGCHTRAPARWETRPVLMMRMVRHRRCLGQMWKMFQPPSWTKVDLLRSPHRCPRAVLRILEHFGGRPKRALVDHVWYEEDNFRLLKRHFQLMVWIDHSREWMRAPMIWVYRSAWIYTR